MRRLAKSICATIAVSVFVSASVFASQSSEVLLKIDRMAASSLDKASGADWDSVAESIRTNQTEVAAGLVAKLGDSTLTEQQIEVYVWALGQAKVPSSINAIMEIYRQKSSQRVRRNSLNAIASIGGSDAGRFIQSTLDSSDDKSSRFDALNLLGQLQYEAALPKMEELLSTSAQEFWQAIFVFGKMGDKAVPFLLEKMNSPDSNIRRNAIDLLGRWLIPVAAAKPMEERFWKEPDDELRVLLLASLERMMSDKSQMKSFVERVISEDKSEQVLKFSRGTLDMLNGLKAGLANASLPIKPSAELFQSEYERIFKSAGTKGDYKKLLSASSIDDEQRLKALRERILQRNSDEAFYDYQKVNDIIVFNRLSNL